MHVDADTVEAWLEVLPPDRREMVETLRRTVLAHLPDGYVEVIRWGMITYEVPLEASGKTYNGQPLMYAAIGNQKQHVGLYLCGLYCMPGQLEWFKQRWSAKGQRLDMGKACIRLKSLANVDLQLIGECVGSVTVADYVASAKRSDSKVK